MNTTHQRINSIPYPQTGLIILGRNAHAGALSIGAEVNLAQNTAPKIGLDLHDFIGDPATPLVPGKQALYAAQKVAVKEAYAARNVAITAGREFCRLAINLLRPVLGNQWNTAWQAAGFHLPSLALPSQPVALLGALRAYFGTHAAHENALAGITAAAAEAAADAIDAAILAVGMAKSLLVQRKAERDASLKKLRARLSGLRAELDQLLEDDDGRWELFGFRRPAGGSMPQAVPDLVLNPGGEGIVLVQWGLASQAESYRVSWRVAGDPTEPTELGLFTERQCALRGLPSGQNIVVLVTARNDSGESAPTEAAILVP